ncbi:hypothetical protein LCGC14_2834750 [marine sediment metagenome]|uniref:Uncharacterized protein n=1 Tax=marine sediment metagenome TaxID=412755 RepID=A0A0F8YZL2_9ZZZZ
MTWVDVVRTIIMAVAAFVPIYIYMKRQKKDLETNHFQGIEKEILQIRQDIQGLDQTFRREISAVRGKLDGHIAWHLDHPNPGGGMETT